MEASVLSSIILLQALLVVTNLPAFFLGLEFKGNVPAKRLWFEPSGSSIPLVWMFLFSLLGVLHYKLVLEGADSLSKLVIFLAGVCAAYPYYTLGLEKLTGISALKFALVGNLLIIFSAFSIGIRVSNFDISLSYLIFPIIIWTAYMTMVILGQLRLLRESTL